MSELYLRLHYALLHLNVKLNLVMSCRAKGYFNLPIKFKIIDTLD